MQRALAVDDIDPPTDGAGDKLTVESITGATFGCLRRVAVSKKHRAVLAAAASAAPTAAPLPASPSVVAAGLAKLLRFLLRFAQVTAQQVQRWNDEPDAFNVDEDREAEATELDAGDTECASAVVRTVALDFACTILDTFRSRVKVVAGQKSRTWREGSMALATAVAEILRACQESTGVTWQLEEIAVKMCSLLHDTLDEQQHHHHQQQQQQSHTSPPPPTPPSPLTVQHLFACAMKRMSMFFGGGAGSPRRSVSVCDVQRVHYIE